MRVDDHRAVRGVHGTARKQGSHHDQATENFHVIRAEFKVGEVYCRSLKQGSSAGYRPYWPWVASARAGYIFALRRIGPNAICLAHPRAPRGKNKSRQVMDLAVFFAVLHSTLQEFGRRYWNRTNDLHDVNVAL